MKKLLCVLMLGMMFGQTELTTRVYDYSYNSSNGTVYLDLHTLTGHNLEYAKVYISKVDNFNCDALNYCVLNMTFDYTSVNTLFSNTQIHYQTGYANNNFTNSEAFVLYDSQIDWEENIKFKASGHQGWYNSLSVDFKIEITAPFPDDDSGDTNGDGYDDVCYEAGADSGDVNGDGELNVLDMVFMHMR